MSWSRSTGRDNKAPRKTRLGRVVTSSTKGKGKKSVSQLAREELVGKKSAKSRQKQKGTTKKQQNNTEEDDGINFIDKNHLAALTVPDAVEDPESCDIQTAPDVSPAQEAPASPRIEQAMEAVTPTRNSALEDIKHQIMEKKIRKEKERLAEMKFNEKVEREAARYDPWGRPGSGAALRDPVSGKPVANLRNSGRQITATGRTPTHRDRNATTREFPGSPSVQTTAPQPPAHQRHGSKTKVDARTVASPAAPPACAAQASTPSQVKMSSPSKNKKMEEIKLQMRLKAERKERERLEEIALNKKIEEEALKYDPWGRSGCGAPNVDKRTGRVVRDLRTTGLQISATGRMPVSTSGTRAESAPVESESSEKIDHSQADTDPVETPDLPATTKKMSPAEEYRAELQEQINLKRARKAQEKQKAREWELKKEKEMTSYDPFGRSGCGAPIRNDDGKAVANLRMHAGQNGTNLITVHRNID